MVVFFPLIQQGELLGSLLARYAHLQGIRDDKVVLECLFASRTVIPSPLLQGHIQQLLTNVGHIWRITPLQIIEAHTLLPLFKPFISRQRYSLLCNNLISEHLNTSSLRSGINASILNWNTSYKICPLCWSEQQKELGFSYWQRLFQCPGVESCPVHLCRLVTTEIPLTSPHRHRFVGTTEFDFELNYSQVATAKEHKLTQLVVELLDGTDKEVGQWSTFYRQLAINSGFTRGVRLDHKAIAEQVKDYWGDSWLQRYGLTLKGENTWLLSMFRKHKHPFTYLQHFAVWLALKPEPFELSGMLEIGNKLANCLKERKIYQSSSNQQKVATRRNLWLKLIKLGHSLKQLRMMKSGNYLYSWLYRYDNTWLQKHKPELAINYQNRRVNWPKRDLCLVRQLIKIERDTQFDLYGERRSRSWYSKQLGVKSLIEKKLYKLPLCAEFFCRYSEDIDEYQTRRLIRVCSEYTNNKDYSKGVCEIEKIAGLSQQRIRKYTKLILESDVPSWFVSQVNLTKI